MPDFLGGLFGGGDDPPPPPDVNATAQQQIGYGQQVQGLNAPNQTGVFGNTQYTYGPQGNVTGVNTGLNPQYQQVQNTLLGGLGTQPGAVSDAVYGQYQSRLDPQWDTTEQKLDTQLANQGIPQGSAAWNQARDEFGRQKTDAYGSARRDATIAGGQEQSRLLGGLFGLGQNATAGYQNVPQIATPNTGAYTYQNFGAANNAYNQSQAGSNANLGGLFGLGSAFISAYPWGG
jgi:hypothetical protein